MGSVCEKDDSFLTSFIGNYISSYDAKWKSVSLTHVEYIEGDWFGKGFAWLSLLPIFVIVGLVTLIIFRREIHTITLLLGLACNEILNQILKYGIQSPRPCRKNELFALKFGMPSDHAQFSGFFGIYMILFIQFRLSNHTAENFGDSIWKCLVSLGCFVTTLLVCISRVYLRYHSVEQIVWGLLIGLGMGALWFTITQKILTPIYPDIVSWKLSEKLLIRDSTRIPNIMWFEYTSSRMEARQRHRRGSLKSK